MTIALVRAFLSAIPTGLPGKLDSSTQAPVNGWGLFFRVAREDDGRVHFLHTATLSTNSFDGATAAKVACQKPPPDVSLLDLAIAMTNKARDVARRQSEPPFQFSKDIVNEVIADILEKEMKKLNEMTSAELVATYNALQTDESKRVNKFADKQTGIQRIEKLRAQLAPKGDDRPPAAPADEGGAKPAAVAKPAAKPAATTSRDPYDIMRGGSKAEPPAPIEGQKLGRYCCSLIMDGRYSDDAIVAAALAHFKGAKTNKSNIAWYRGDLKKKGCRLPDRVAA